MKRTFHEMIPNDRMYIENDGAWFIDRKNNNLFRWIPSTEFCEHIATLPRGSKNGNPIWRENPFCIKYYDKIVCLPDKGKYIWIYSMSQKEFKKVEIDNPNFMVLGIGNYWIDQGKLWAWSGGLERLIEIDLDSDRVENYFQISENKKEKFAAEAVKVENLIYLFGSELGIIYEFNITSKRIEQYEIKGVQKGIRTFCFDGTLFWLSGLTKCIYTWNKETKELNEYTDFPQDFEMTGNGQMPIFYQSACLDKYVCLVPLILAVPKTLCDSILFVDKKSHQMKSIKVYNGEHEEILYGYTLEYVIGGRYVGIYYPFYNHIFEIDTKDFSIKDKGMFFDAASYTLGIW